MTSPPALPFPAHLQAAGTADAPFEALLSLAELPPGTLRRVTRGDLDVLLVHSDARIAALEDRCPHMSVPFSSGSLEGCLLRCPLHRGTFDLRDGEVVDFPTTGGLTADGEPRAAWAPEGDTRPAPSDAKALARSLTRVRRLRYFPVRIEDGRVEVALPR